MGATKQKVLLLLVSGLALGLTHRPDKQWQIVRGLVAGWKEIDRSNLNRAVRGLYRSHLVREHLHKDGSVSMVLTHEGKKMALRYNLATLKLNKDELWDRKWRIVMYDVPESNRAFREDLLRSLRHLGFHEVQQSVLVYPYECRKELEFFIEAYDAREYIRYIEATYIDDDSYLKHLFRLK
jgi:DNA-binding transcriptional regulator PaaX